MGGCARCGDNGGDGGWARDDADIDAWCGDQQGCGALQDGGRGGHEGCGDGQASGGDWNTGRVDDALGRCARAAFGDGEGLTLREKISMRFTRRLILESST